MKWIGMHPGQGSQEAGMGKELLENHKELLVDSFEDTLGWSLVDVINNADNEEIKKTNIAQPYIFAISYCYGLETIKNMGEPAALIGHSLGEYTALALSGYFDYTDALKVIAVRGEEMQKAVQDSNTGMSAVLTSNLKKTLEEINNLNINSILVEIGLEDSITSQRTNGFMNALNKIKEQIN